MLNAIGLQGIGVHRFIARKAAGAARARAPPSSSTSAAPRSTSTSSSRGSCPTPKACAALELNISCPNIKEGGITFGCSLHGTFDVVSAVQKGHAPAGDPEADAERHRRRLVRARVGRRRRRRRLARQHVPGDGDRRRDAPAEALEHRRRAERTGDPADRGADGLRVPAGGEDSGHRHGRHRHARATRWSSSSPAPPRCRSARRTSSTRSSGRSCSTASRDYLRRHEHRARRRPRRHASTPPRARSNGSAPSRARRRHRRARARARVSAAGASPADSRSAAACSRSKGPALVRELVDARRPRVPRSQVPRHPEHGGAGGRGGRRRPAPGWSTSTRPAAVADDAGGRARPGARPRERLGRPAPLVIAVTVLTSMDDDGAARDRRRAAVLEQVVALATMAQAAGLDGVVASPQETAAIRRACGDDVPDRHAGHSRRIRAARSQTIRRGRWDRQKRSGRARATSSSDGRSSRPQTRVGPQKRLWRN